MKRLLSFYLAFCATAALWAAFTPAKFTVSADGRQVYFSQGNLQCSGVISGEYVWSFAENQYDMLGSANVSSGKLADKIDLFGWSTNNTTTPWGISTSQIASDYAGDFVDWGTNAIDAYAANAYRTLTKDEWKYLLDTRDKASEKMGVARIKLSETEYANGLILLPDSWNAPEGVAFKSGFASSSGAEYYATYQTFTLAEWQKLEAAGAVFLPASGYRYGSDVDDVQYYGDYWSATALDSSYAFCLYFSSNVAYALDYNDRGNGQAVRLVQDIKYNIALNKPEHGTLMADKTEAISGETVTLTVSSSENYYILKEITVLQGETPVATTAVEGTSDQYTFTMPQGDVTISAEFEKLASAFTPAKFTISESGKQVLFSQGNLQCTPSATDTTWSFAEYQTEMIGTDNVSGSALADKIDLFGWSGSTGSAKWGISASTSYSDYSGDFVDWGTNTIGTNAPNTYRTLTQAEWNYLLNTRTNADNKKGIARIKLNDDDTQYANGLILLHDDWTCPTDVTFKSGFSSDWSVEAYATYQTFSLAEWQKLESAGAVFLPASGYRIGSSMDYVQNFGNYWSASADGSNYAYRLRFYSSGADAYSYGNRYYGQAVRLVRDVSSPVTALQPAAGIAIYTENGRIVCAHDFQIFDLLGRNVTRLNGSLNGIYIVKVGDKAQKVVVK